MTDIINTPAASDSGGTGVLIGGIVFVIIALLLIFYGLPAMRGAAQNSATTAPAVQVREVPRTESDGVGSIEIPDKIDVNVNQSEE